MNAPAGGHPRIQIPRWIQLVGLPLLILFGWVLATTAGHAVILFLIAALIALLLDPIVRAMGRARIRRGFSVAIVYSTFAALVILVVIAIGSVVVGQTKTAAERLNDYFNASDGRTRQTEADRALKGDQTLTSQANTFTGPQLKAMGKDLGERVILEHVVDGIVQLAGGPG